MHHQGQSLSEAGAQCDTPRRSWVHRQLLSIFHGELYILSTRTRSFPRTQKSSWMSQQNSSNTNSTSQSGLRSPTSTRSLIDPSASPISSAGTISPGAFEPIQMHTNPPSVAYARPESTHSGARAERHLSRALNSPLRRNAPQRSGPQRRKWVCLPNINHPKHRRKAIGSLVTGIILALMLSTCAPQSSLIQMESELTSPNRPCACDLQSNIRPDLARRPHYVCPGHSYPFLPQFDSTLHACPQQPKISSKSRNSQRI